MLTQNFEITRNPLKNIQKVFKYEFLNTSRTFIPLFSVTLILGLLFGISGKNENVNFYMDFQGSMGSQTYSLNNSMADSFFSGLFGVTSVFLITIFSIVTIILLSKRFTKGMLGEEGYFNLTLPVTIAEHLWGRLLAYLCWIFIEIFVVIVSCYLSFIKTLKIGTLFEGLKQFHGYLGQHNIPIPVFYLEILLILIVVSSMIILFVFCINSIAHLFKTHRTLAKVGSTILLLFITNKIWDFIYNVKFLKSFTNGAGMFILVNLIICTVYMIISQIIFTRELNLE